MNADGIVSTAERQPLGARLNRGRLANRLSVQTKDGQAREQHSHCLHNPSASILCFFAPVSTALSYLIGLFTSQKRPQ
jgi:hypothetical protein